MRFTDTFIQRPVLAIVVSLLILLMGVQAFTQLSVREFPKIENSTITITTSYPGASQDAVKSFITTTIQQAVASAEGIDYVQATSRPGRSTVFIQLKLDADIDRSFTDVTAKVDQVRFLLPREAFDPVISREDAQLQAPMYIDFKSDTMTPSQITDYLLRIGQPALQAVEGVGSAAILGPQTFAMRIWLQPQRMAALQVTATDVRDALLRNNFTAAAGTVKSDYIETVVDARTDLASTDDFKALVVANRNGTLIRLQDVASVELGPETSDVASFAGGKRAIFVAISTVPGGSAVEVLPKVRERIEQLKTNLPPGLEINISWDATSYINSAIFEVLLTVAEAALIVVLVVFLFLGSARSTLIPIVTIPLSLIGVLFLMQVMGYSINLLTLLALVLAIGLVVDDAIVVVENISRHIEEGMAPPKAALQGAREIAMPVIGMTVTLAAVYAPIGFVGGLTGKLFQEFAFTLAAAVIISGVVALTLSPMMCAKILKAPHAPDPSHGRTHRAISAFQNWLTDRFNRGFARVQSSYTRALARSLDARWASAVIGVVLLGACYMFYTKTPKELAPNEDYGFVFLINQSPEWSNIDYLNTYVAKMHGIFSTYPEYATSFLVNGGDRTSTGFGGMLLKDWSERDRSPNDIIPQLAGQLNGLSGISTLAVSPGSLPTGGTFPVDVVVRSEGSTQELAAAVARLQDAATKSGLFIFTDTSLRYDKPQIDIDIDRAKANSLGVTMADIGDTLATLLGGNYVNLFELEGRSYRVIPQVARQDRLTPELLASYYVRTASGDLVPLSNFVSLSRSVQPNALTTFQQLNSAKIEGVPWPGRTPGEALAFLQAEAAKLGPGFSLDYAGISRQYVQEGARLTIVFGFALLLIFLVLAAQFESFRDPVIILVSVPLSLAGALGALNILSFAQVPGATINIYTQIGLITLAGLISKHGILMVEFANQLQAQKGMDRHAAIIEAASVRLRPILMTTAAMVAGVIPLLMATGAGAVSRFAIGLVIASGLVVGTLLTLFLVPAVYSWMAGDHRRALPDAAPIPLPQAAE